eukprot:scaffold418_cov386-Prasinococcus_capsulatus_cf.AAC.1
MRPLLVKHMKVSFHTSLFGFFGSLLRCSYITKHQLGLPILPSGRKWNLHAVPVRWRLGGHGRAALQVSAGGPALRL